MGLALTTHGNLVTPDIFGVLGHKVGDLSRNVTGGYGVGASVADPFDRKRLAWEGVSRVIKRIVPNNNLQRWITATLAAL